MWQVEGLCGSSLGRKPGAGWTHSWEGKEEGKQESGVEEKKQRHRGDDKKTGEGRVLNMVTMNTLSTYMHKELVLAYQD